MLVFPDGSQVGTLGGGCVEVYEGSHLHGLATHLGGVVPDDKVAASEANEKALPIPTVAGEVRAPVDEETDLRVTERIGGGLLIKPDDPVLSAELTGPQEVGNVDDVDIKLSEHELNGRIYRPEGDGPFPVILYIHGAGWVFGNAHTHDRLVRELATKAGVIQLSRVVAAQYASKGFHGALVSNDREGRTSGFEGWASYRAAEHPTGRQRPRASSRSSCSSPSLLP